MSMRIATITALLVGAILAGCAESLEDESYQRFMRAQQESLSAWVASPNPDSQPAAGVPDGEITEDSTLRDYLAYAALHSPELEAAFDAWQAELERIPQARALPDPQLSYKYFIVGPMMRDGEMRHEFGLSQMFPWLGKLLLRGEVAAEEAQAARHRFDAAMLKLFYGVHMAYAEYYYLHRSIGITEENVALLQQIEATARARYAVGAAAHPDVIRAQVEQGKLADQLRTLQKFRAPLMARLNAALNRPANAPLPWPKDVPQVAGDLSDEHLLTWAAQANPEVQAMDREIAARQEGIDLARQDYYPDVMVGVEYDLMAHTSVSDGDMNPIGIMVGLNIPIWWQKYAAGVREARWRHSLAVHAKAALVNSLSADVEMALFEFQDAGRKINLYRDTLIPKAAQALQAAQIAYAATKVGFQDYLDAQRVLLEFQLSYERSLADRTQRMAELEMLVGKRLPVSAPQGP
jgi:outer membrane protein TolC